ncbi:MAG: hypothetical protein ACK5H1_08685 [Tenacibaculum sp.]
MKKLIILILFFLIKNNLFSQISLTGEAKYKLTISGYVGIDPIACGNTFGLRSITAKYNNGKIVVWEGRVYSTTFNHTVEYNKNRLITEVAFHEINQWETVLFCNGGPDDIYSKTLIKNACHNSNENRKGQQLSNVRIKSEPVVSINKKNTPLYLDDISFLTINLPNNLKKTHYNWKYKVGNGITKTIPYPYNYTNRLNIKGKDFLKDSDFGRVVSVWLDADCKKSNAIQFTYLKRAPNINSVESTTLLQCYDNEDGSAKVNFDRALVDRELLSISLKNNTNGLDYSESNISALNADNSYTFTNLPSGKYTLKLIGSAPGYNNGMYNTYTGGVKHEASFTISRPKPVEFTITHSTPVLCHGGSDGSITLEIQGGQILKTNKYLLRKKGDTSPVLENDWKELTNSTISSSFFNFIKTGVITDIPAGNYTIKVKDINDCIAKRIVKDGAGNIIGLAEEVAENIEISEPKNPVKIYFIYEIP